MVAVCWWFASEVGLIAGVASTYFDWLIAFGGLLLFVTLFNLFVMFVFWF